MSRAKAEQNMNNAQEERLQTCQHGIPYQSREDGIDVEACGDPAIVRIRWKDDEDSSDGWGEWLYLCEEHYEKVKEAESHD